MPQVLDVSQSLLLLELEPPFGEREVQMARRRMAKRWHPDIAPPGRQHEHERHLKAVNEAADQLEQLAKTSHGGQVSRNAVRASAAAARARRAEEGARAYAREQEARAAAKDRAANDPFADRMPDHSDVHRYARCLSWPEWGVGTVAGIYFSGEGDDVQQWARVQFAEGIRTVPAGSLSFVDFSRPDPGAERASRFVAAGQHAMAEGNFALAARRFVFARDAAPKDPAVLRLLTVAQWQAGDLLAAGRAVRDWARVEGARPAPHRYAARIYEDMGAVSLAAEAAERAVDRAPGDAEAWHRVGRLRLRLGHRATALRALTEAQRLAPTVDGLLDLALAQQLAGDLGAELSAVEAATRLDPRSAAAWSRLAHAHARGEQVREALRAADRALALAPDDEEVAALRERLLAAEPRALADATAPAAA